MSQIFQVHKMETGNKSLENDLLQVFLVAEKKTMKDLNVAEVAIVNKIDNNKYRCTLINNSKTVLDCYCMDGVNVQEKDVVVVLFTNTDFRTNFKRLLSEAEVQNIESKEYHSKNFAIIIGKLI